MHPYDVVGRPKVYISLALLSIPPVWLVDWVITSVGFNPQWWVVGPSYGLWYSAFLWALDQYVWRLKPLRGLGLIQVPDLNGTWTGAINTSFGDSSSKYPVSLNIVQTWSKILVRLEAEHSHSRSQAAMIRNVDQSTAELAYLYWNEPSMDSAESMQVHRGTAVLELRDETLDGQYYTGRGRREIGSIRVTRSE